MLPHPHHPLSLSPLPSPTQSLSTLARLIAADDEIATLLADPLVVATVFAPNNAAFECVGWHPAAAFAAAAAAAFASSSKQNAQSLLFQLVTTSICACLLQAPPAVLPGQS